MKTTVIIYRKDGTVRVMKVKKDANISGLGLAIDGANYLRQEAI